MKTIIKKVFTWDETEAFQQIIDIYDKKWYAIVNYVYFANLARYWILDWKKCEYKDSLCKSDLLLPDGIALQMYLKSKFKMAVNNLNGTDFAPFFLKALKKKTNINLILFWAYPEDTKKANEYVKNKLWVETIYFQDWYSELDWSKIKIIDEWYNILLIGLWTPKQENWVFDNLEKIKKHKLIVFWQWWTFDFWSWKESRAPKIFRTLHLEWLFRIITQPKKNFMKVMYSFLLFYYLAKRKK